MIERLEVFIVTQGPLEEQEVKLMRAIQEAAQERNALTRSGDAAPSPHTYAKRNFS